MQNKEKKLQQFDAAVYKIIKYLKLNIVQEEIKSKKIKRGQNLPSKEKRG